MLTNHMSCWETFLLKQTCFALSEFYHFYIIHFYHGQSYFPLISYCFALSELFLFLYPTILHCRLLPFYTILKFCIVRVISPYIIHFYHGYFPFISYYIALAGVISFLYPTILH